MPPLVGTEPNFHQHIEGRRVISRLLFVVCFCLCSVAAMHGQQASFVEQVIGESDTGGGANCEKYSTTKLAISCTGNWSAPSAEGYEIAKAQNGFGSMKGYSYSSVTIAVNHGDGEDSAPVNEIVEDYLSILGLKGEPTAFLKLEFECVVCANVIYPAAYYTAYAGVYGPCQIYGPSDNPRCTLKVPIAYNGNGQPSPVSLQRQLQINAVTNVVNAPAGVTVTTTVCVGYNDCSSGATVKASVVNAKGKVFKGVTVVGASGHIYN
jgi:hypothetical protein